MNNGEPITQIYTKRDFTEIGCSKSGGIIDSNFLVKLAIKSQIDKLNEFEPFNQKSQAFVVGLSTTN